VNKNHSTNDIPKNLALGGTITSCEQEAANLFATHFSFVYSNEKVVVENSDLIISTYFDLPNNVSFSVEYVFQKLIELRGDWSVGPDGLNSEFSFSLDK